MIKRDETTTATGSSLAKYRRNWLVQPPTFLLLAIGLMLVLDSYIPVMEVVAFPMTLIGVLPMAAGVGIALVVEIEFKARRTTIWPFDRPKALVTDGPFRLSRNPVYVGQVLALSGVALLLGTLTPWLAVLVHLVILDRLHIRAEEANLRAAFGCDYEEYCRKVRRWV